MSKIFKIMSQETNYGTFDELLNIANEEVRPIASKLRELIFEIDPESC